MTNNIAILLATYNGEKYLREQLNSLLAQTAQNWVCYIHDDGSSDGTVNIAKEYAAKYGGKFVVLDYPPLGGAAVNFLSLVNRVSEPYMMFCDQDDVWLPDKIELTMNKMIKTETDRNRQKQTETDTSIPICVFTDVKVVDAELNVIAESHIKHLGRDGSKITFQSLLFHNCASCLSMMINRALAEYVPLQEEKPSVIIHDHLLVLLAMSDGVVSFIPESTALYRQHGNNTIGTRKTLFVHMPLRKQAKQMYHYAAYVLFTLILKRENTFIVTRKKLAADLLSYCEPRNPESVRLLKNLRDMPWYKLGWFYRQ